MAVSGGRFDANQIFKNVYDPNTQRLKVDSNASISDVVLDFDLDAAEGDNVAISDGTNTLVVNPNGSINTVLSFPTRVLTTTYNEVVNVANGVTALVVSYTATINNLLQKIEFSGTNIAEYELTINNVTKDKKRTYFGNSLNGNFDFNDGLVVLPGEIIKIYVIHTRPNFGDFNARIQILEIE